MKKSTLRVQYLEKRKRLTLKEIEERNDAILKKVQQFLTGKSFTTVHIFLPLEGKGEIDTWRIIAFLKTLSGMRIAAPRIVPGTKEMEHFQLTSETTFISSRWGIPEPGPETTARIDAKEIDAVFIPLLAFDEKGFRVGYGGGYYDRFLAHCKPTVTKIGLSFFEPVEEISGMDVFDIAMDFCITPLQIIDLS